MYDIQQKTPLYTCPMNSYFDQVDDNLRRLKLVTHVLAEVQTQLVDPLYPDAKADLILASEDLAQTAFEILELARDLTWSNNITPPSDFS